MAKLHINQFAALATANGSTQPLPTMPPAAQQNVTFTTSTQSAAAEARQVWQVVADAACYIEVGANPTATADSTPLAAGQFFEFQIAGGHKVAALAQ